MFGDFDAYFAKGKRRFIQANTRDAVTLNATFNPHKYFGIHRLRTGIAAKQSTRDGREQKQAQRRDNQ